MSDQPKIILDASNATRAAQRATVKTGVPHVRERAPDGRKGWVVVPEKPALNDTPASDTPKPDAEHPMTNEQARAMAEGMSPMATAAQQNGPVTASHHRLKLSEISAATAAALKAARAGERGPVVQPPSDPGEITLTATVGSLEAAQDMARALANRTGVTVQASFKGQDFEAHPRPPRVPEAKPAKDHTIKPVIASATNARMQRLIDRIDAARGDLDALRAFQFKRNSTYYQMAGRFLDALIEQAEAENEA